MLQAGPSQNSGNLASEPSASGPSGSSRPEKRGPAVRVFDAAHIEEQASALRNDNSVKARAGKWAAAQKTEFQHKQATYSFVDWLAVVLPCLSWIKTYKVCSIS